MIALATIAFNRPRMIAEQIRLLGDYLIDEHELLVYDASSDAGAAEEIRLLCEGRTPYWRAGTHRHHEALNEAARALGSRGEHIGFLDHDVFPTKPTRLEPLIEEAGFYGVGQRHPATGRLYLWPGFCFFSREWLGDRELDFSGLRDGDPRNDGDTGSSLWSLFADEDWEKLYRAPHAHEAIRRPDNFGLQSWGVERIGDWLHLSNASDWMAVPNPGERERIVLAMLEAL